MDVIGHVIKDLLNYWHTTQLHHPGIQSQMSIWATMTLWLSIMEQSWIDATCFVCPCFYLELTHFAITRMRIKKNFHEHLFREHFLLHCTTRELINSSLNLKKNIFSTTQSSHVLDWMCYYVRCKKKLEWDFDVSFGGTNSWFED